MKSDNGSDPQMQNRHGTSFPLDGGKLAIAEVQFSYPALGSMVEPGQSQPLGWTYRIGAWYDGKAFADQRLDDAGRSLADPASSGVPQPHRGDYAFYAVADSWSGATRRTPTAPRRSSPASWAPRSRTAT